MRAQILRIPSLEFRWLPNSETKGLTTPRVILVESEFCGGFYMGKTSERHVPVLDGEPLDIDLKEGAVVGLCAIRNAGTLAHEFRHHQQRECGRLTESSVWNIAEGESYKQAIVRYFRTYWWEMDALLFEHRFGANEVNQLWLDWLRTYRAPVAA